MFGDVLIGVIAIDVWGVTSLPTLQAAKEHTAGDAWFNLPATQITPELRNDLKVLRMRGAIDPQRHYKKADSKELPKYFQVRNRSSACEFRLQLSFYPHPSLPRPLRLVVLWVVL